MTDGHSYAMDASPPPSNDNSQLGHTRTYQACIPCRKRKVRCNLGPVDNPHDPPCDRCRRESKECFFSATRRKKRAADSGADDSAEPEDLEVRGGRKRLKGEDDDFNDANVRGFSSYPLTPGGLPPPPRPVPRPPMRTSVSYSQHSSRDAHEDEQVSAHSAAILQVAEVHSGHDALKTLLEAATTHAGGSLSTTSRNDGIAGRSPRDIPMISPVTARRPTNNTLPPPMFSPAQSQTDPSLRGASAYDSTANTSAAELTAALKAWSRFRFVRAGWFSAREAIDYVNFFYTHLSPLTPIVMPEYASLSRHATLLEDEPMLAVTILTIASRHMKLSGAGSQSRPYAIHQKLWSYLEGMINRLVWGQEQFGGSNVSGSQFGSDIVPYLRRGLRTLGTVESLMLLTEWHPRSMHFPPDDDDSELMTPEHPADFLASDDGTGDSSKGIGGQRMDTWLEPCWRSDRICWMLLSMAMSLGFEIGVFDSDTARHLTDSSVSEEKIRAYDRRRLHVKDLLLVYTTQTSGRVGLSTMLPENYCDPALSHIFDIRNIAVGNTKDMVIHLWLKIASIMKRGNEQLFANREVTRDIVRTGSYKKLLHELTPVLSNWRKTLDNVHDIPAPMRHVLVIDYEYCRVYLNSLGLQAVVERCTQTVHKQNAANGNRSATDSTIPPSVLEQCYGNDRHYINEAVDGCRKLLRAVVEGLYPGDHLRHAPVRTYFRIISVAIVLLKTFALGATEDDVAISLGYLDRTIEALQSCIVDDVHVASRFSDLLETLTCRIRQRFVRMSRNGQSGLSRGTSKSPADAQGAVPTSQPVNPGQLRRSLSTTQWSGHPAAQQYQSSSTPRMGSGANTSNSNNNNNPLWGISTQSFDFDENAPSFSVMPPPTNPSSPVFSRSSLGPNGYGGYGGRNDFGNASDADVPDWLALPLDPILNSYGADVTQNGYGPGVGEYDMLELLLNGGGGS